MLWKSLLFLLCSTAALAQQCPGSNAAWSFAMPAPYQWAVYDLTGEYTLPLGYLSVIYQSRVAETFIGVPQGQAQKFQASAHPDQFFEQQVKHRYHELLLNPGSNCPLLNPGSGALWTQ